MTSEMLARSVIVPRGGSKSAYLRRRCPPASSSSPPSHHCAFAPPPSTVVICAVGSGTAPSSFATVQAPRGGKFLPMLSATILLILFQALFSSVVPIAAASDYGSMSPKQRFVAEAWRIVDNAYIDRTFFNRRDWFKM